jgi:hypothetical protein
VITTRIADRLSEELLRGRISRKDKVLVDVSPEGGFTFKAQPRPNETTSETVPVPSLR